MVVAQDELVASEDATQDERFAYPSFVQGDEPGCVPTSPPLCAMSDGAVVGTPCAWDSGALTSRLIATMRSIREDPRNAPEFVDAAFHATRPARGPVGPAQRRRGPRGAEIALWQPKAPAGGGSVPGP